MWIIDSWKKWSQSQYDVWGSKLQDKYNFWQDYDNPELREKCKLVWDRMSPAMQKKIYEMLVEALKEYGADFAKNLMAKMSEVFVKPLA